MLAAERAADVLGRKIAHIRLDRRIAPARQAKPRAVRMKQVEQTIIRPVERIDAERVFAVRHPERHRDEEATLEGANLRDVALDAKLGLAPDHMAADRGGERRGHAAHRSVTLSDVAID